MSEERRKFWMKEYNAAKQELDYWRQRDNFVLFALNNPPEHDEKRKYFLENMRRCMGEMEHIRELLDSNEDANPADMSAGWEL